MGYLYSYYYIYGTNLISIHLTLQMHDFYTFQSIKVFVRVVRALHQLHVIKKNHSKWWCRVRGAFQLSIVADGLKINFLQLYRYQSHSNSYLCVWIRAFVIPIVVPEVHLHSAPRNVNVVYAPSVHLIWILCHQDINCAQISTIRQRIDTCGNTLAVFHSYEISRCLCEHAMFRCRSCTWIIRISKRSSYLWETATTHCRFTRALIRFMVSFQITPNKVYWI